MTDQDKNTVSELAELIADQNERIRDLANEIEEQNDLIVEYELDQENSEKIDASLYADLVQALDFTTLKGTRVALESILENYFGDGE